MPAMPRKLPPFVQVERTRHGKVVFYFRRSRGKKHRLPDVTDPAFGAAYARLMEGQPVRHVRAAPVKDTLAWLVQQWRGSSDWVLTKPATKRQRENILKHVLERNGLVPCKSIQQAHIRQGREDRMATPAAANNFLKTMRALFCWAKDAKHVDADPTEGVKFLSHETDGFTPWTADDVARYRARWPLGTRPRLALEVLLNTGLRRGDAVRLGRQHVRDGLATLRLEKTAVELSLPILPALQAAIEAGPVGDLAFIATENGRPMTKETFGNLFRDWCSKAGVKASAHGLRKLAAATIAEAGGSEEELQAFFGWKSIGQSSTYTRSASKKKKAMSAAMKLSGNASVPHLDAGKGFDAETPSKIKGGK